KEILFGLDYLEYLKSTGTQNTVALQMDLEGTDALFLNYNLKHKFTGLNLYEKLLFIKKTAACDKSVIYRDTELDIAIDKNLLQHIDGLLAEEFKPALIAEHITLKSALKLCSFDAENRAPLLKLFTGIPFSSSHQLKILEMSEEILFREKCTMAEIFEKLCINRFLDENSATEKPQKKIVDSLFTFRNPVFVEREEKWQKELKEFKLPTNMKVSHFPFFEKRELELTVRFRSAEELQHFLKEKK
ncbi:MAG: hypothetical protein GY757_44835, partial [bacterium]|nr:hypothetical protein [bacterium]